MGQERNDSELDARISELESILSELTDRYLDGPDSVYTLYFEEIASPAVPDLECRFDDPEKGVRSFLMEALNGPAPFGGVILSDEDGGNSFMLPRAVSLTREDLTQLFADPILQALVPFQPSAYALSKAGRSKYEALLKPFWCTGMIALSIEGKWFMLTGEWSD